MAIGISTSCLYPLETEISFDMLGKMGVKTCEIFLNSYGETSTDFAKELLKTKNEYGIHVASVHPFSSFSETHMLFSEYKRRFYDGIDFYKRCSETAAVLGAKVLVIHGSKFPAKISNNEYFERFGKLVEAGKEYGITVCQENVHAHFSESPEFLKNMRTYLGDNFRMVFDVKQAVRSGYEPLAFADEFKNEIVHIHLSDHISGKDCMPPGTGSFDFGKLFDIMKSADYKGDYVIELYRSNYGQPDELAKALAYLQNL
ncbi:MAG: sugar phosphate isomerase/epimerase [Acutalibacteraceae bacterium]|nr:sugar phosphate isomerase/epimerase [Acutalibacteraceae bacterium]